MFHEALKAAKSLDEIIALHDQQYVSVLLHRSTANRELSLDRLQERCMLGESVSVPSFWAPIVSESF